MSEFKFSLSKAQVIQKRLTELLQNQLAQILALDTVDMTEVRWKTETEENLLSEIESNNKSIMSKLNVIFKLSENIFEIRNAIAKANFENGINEELTRINMLQNLANTLNTIVRSATSNRRNIDVHQIASTLNFWKDLTDNDYISADNISALTKLDIATIEDRIKQYKLQIIAAKDKVQELNALTKITVSLDDEIAEEVGL